MKQLLRFMSVVDSPQGMRFAANGKTLCVVDSKHRLTAIDAFSGKVLHTVDLTVFGATPLWMSVYPTQESDFIVLFSIAKDNGRFLVNEFYVGLYEVGSHVELAYSQQCTGPVVFGAYRYKNGNLAVASGSDLTIFGNDLKPIHRHSCEPDYLTLTGLGYDQHNGNIYSVASHQTGSRVSYFEYTDEGLTLRCHFDTDEPSVAGIAVHSEKSLVAVLYSHINDLHEPSEGSRIAVGRICTSTSSLKDVACKDVLGDLGRDYMPSNAKVEKLDPIKGWIAVDNVHSVRRELTAPAFFPALSDAILFGLPSGDLCEYDIATGQFLQTNIFSDPLACVDSDAKSGRLAVASEKGDIALFDCGGSNA
jgi:hypothetical protein